MHLELFFFTLHFFKTFYPRMNKSNIHNNIIGILSFQTDLNNLFSSNGFYFKSKVIEGSQGWALFLKIHFWDFFWTSGYSFNSIFSVAVSTYQTDVFDETFFL